MAVATWLGSPLVASLTVALVLVFVWWRFQPKLLPGVPYNKGIGFFGDLPELISLTLKGNSVRPWFWGMATRHNSPITQFILRPFDKPTILLTDYRETNDILYKRGHEFDRSGRSTECFSTIIPSHHIAMKSSHPHFRGNKELVKDLMTPGFLHDVSMPTLYSKLMELIELWNFKAEVANGRPFPAHRDIDESAMDTIFAVAFGEKHERSVSKLKLEALSQSQSLDVPGDVNTPYEFSDVPLPPEVDTLNRVNQTMWVSFASPIPRLHHWFLRQTIWRKSFARKESFITSEITDSVRRLAAAKDKKAACRCAMDHMVSRELAIAEKEGRQPDFNTPNMRDELFGFLTAGHETTSTTESWILKQLADHQDIQTKLRTELHKYFAAAYTEKRQPTATEILQLEAPYLSAFIQESLRIAPTLPILMRESTVDTEILGHHIPKDTTVMFMTLGTSITEPTVAIPTGVRTESSEKSKSRVPDWDDAKIGDYYPERWLKKREGGSSDYDVEFDANAGPMLTFGAGPRGCFGKRLAVIQLRVTMALLVWNFEFEKCPPELSSYDGTDFLTTVPKQCYVKLRKLW